MRRTYQISIAVLVASAVVVPFVVSLTAYGAAADGGSAGAADDASWCQQGTDPAVVCVDLTAGNRTVTFAPPRNVYPINTALAVYVRHPGVWGVSATLGGTEGISEPTLTTTGAGGAGHLFDLRVRDAAAAAPPLIATSTFRFSPRVAGAAPLAISWWVSGDGGPPPGGGGSADAGVGTLTVDLQVESVSWGAVRFGVGTIFGDTVGKGYKAQTAPGSSQTEIVQTDNSRMGFEAVLGLAPYVFDVLSCPGKGRSYTGGCNRHVAPYVGFGIIGGSTTASVQTFDSVYLGFEWAFSSNYSLTASFVARQRAELASGYREGSPVDANTTFTRNATGYGFGFVLNLTPDFFSLPTPPSGGSKD